MEADGYQQWISLVLPEQRGQVFGHDHGELMTMLVRGGSLLLLQSLSPAQEALDLTRPDICAPILKVEDDLQGTHK